METHGVPLCWTPCPCQRRTLSRYHPKALSLLRKQASNLSNCRPFPPRWNPVFPMLTTAATLLAGGCELRRNIQKRSELRRGHQRHPSGSSQRGDHPWRKRARWFVRCWQKQQGLKAVESSYGRWQLVGWQLLWWAYWKETVIILVCLPNGHLWLEECVRVIEHLRHFKRDHLGRQYLYLRIQNCPIHPTCRILVFFPLWCISWITNCREKVERGWLSRKVST